MKYSHLRHSNQIKTKGHEDICQLDSLKYVQPAQIVTNSVPIISSLNGHQVKSAIPKFHTLSFSHQLNCNKEVKRQKLKLCSNLTNQIYDEFKKSEKNKSSSNRQQKQNLFRQDKAIHKNIETQKLPIQPISSLFCCTLLDSCLSSIEEFNAYYPKAITRIESKLINSTAKLKKNKRIAINQLFSHRQTLQNEPQPQILGCSIQAALQKQYTIQDLKMFNQDKPNNFGKSSNQQQNGSAAMLQKGSYIKQSAKYIQIPLCILHKGYLQKEPTFDFLPSAEINL